MCGKNFISLMLIVDLLKFFVFEECTILNQFVTFQTNLINHFRRSTILTSQNSLFTAFTSTPTASCLISNT